MPILNAYSRVLPLVLTGLVLLPGCPPAPAETDSDTGSSSSAPVTTTNATVDLTSTGFELLCQPGEERCAADNTREICKATGLAWEQIACGEHQVCSENGDGSATTSCVGPCEVAAGTPNSVGCEFVAIRVRSNNGTSDPMEFFDALIIGNPDEVETAEVQLYFTPNGSYKEEASGDPVLLAPGEAHIFELTNSVIGGYSTSRSGGVYRALSDIPVIAYLNSPFKSSGSNDSSMLLPTRSLRKDYIIGSYPPYVDAAKPDDFNGRPSYFNVVALENKTTIKWTPRADTAGNGFPFLPVAAGETGSLLINRFEVVQVGASSITNTDYESHDVSGTVLSADKPIWVLGGAGCARVPFGGAGSCNHLQEQMIPIEYWGSKYVGAHAPLRGTEQHIWRVYAGEAGVSVTTDPPQPGTPFTLNERGAYKEITVANGKSFTFQGTGPFMPFQYLVGNKAGADNKGDPAMYQMIPIEQFLKRYVFATGVDYGENYAQVIRVKGAADVKINDQVVSGYYLINAVNGLQYEVADVLLPPGPDPAVPVVYLAESDDAFGVQIIGYQTDGLRFTAYAYPGGMALNRLVEL
jgi:hypothetical protein